MLTNLNWLDNGGAYPPASETDRIDQYKLHEQLFLSGHASALRDMFHDIARKTRKKNYDVDTVGHGNILGGNLLWQDKKQYRYYRRLQLKQI